MRFRDVGLPHWVEVPPPLSDAPGISERLPRQGENPATELANAAGLVDYVQIADVPGRGEPGTESIDWPGRLAVLRASGYNGPIGLEYFPTMPSVESLAYTRSVAAGA